jgi:opacity protein-like surface antigen
MKYFGFYLDFSYHRLNMRAQHVKYDDPFALNQAGQIESNGAVATLAFMFAARYGFLPDSEVPFGRLQPYLAVGPGVMFASLEPKLTYYTNTGNFIGTNSYGARSDATICLAVETGLRWMALKNVSLDLSFKYRHAAPEFTTDAHDYDPDYGQDTFTFKPDYHLFSAQLGAAYHF